MFTHLLYLCIGTPPVLGCPPTDLDETTHEVGYVASWGTISWNQTRQCNPKEWAR